MLLGCGGCTAMFLFRSKETGDWLNERMEATELAIIRNAKNKPELTPNSGALAQLSPEIRFGDHAVRLPPGFPDHMQPAARKPGSTTWVWYGPNLIKTGIGMFDAEVLEPPPDVNAEEFFEQYVAGEFKRIRGLGDRHEFKAGRIAGKPAIRATIHERRMGLTSLLVYRFEGNAILILRTGGGPKDPNELRLLEAAILTVRDVGEQ